MAEIVNPIHPEMIQKLDPEFVAYYNANSADKLGPHQIPWSPSIRDTPAVSGTSKPLPVGLTKDYSLSKCLIRVFWPEDPSLRTPPEGGWPVFIFFHGGRLFPRARIYHTQLLICIYGMIILYRRLDTWKY